MTCHSKSKILLQQNNHPKLPEHKNLHDKAGGAGIRYKFITYFEQKDRIVDIYVLIQKQKS